MWLSCASTFAVRDVRERGGEALGTETTGMGRGRRELVLRTGSVDLFTYRPCFFFFEAARSGTRNIRKESARARARHVCSPFPSTKAGARAPRYRYAGIGPRARRARRVAATSAAAAARPRDHDYGPGCADYPLVEDKSNARESRAARGGARSSPLGDDRNARAPSSAPGAFAPSTTAPSPTLERRRVRVRSRPRARSDSRAARRGLPPRFEAERARVASAPVVRRYAAATMRSMDDPEYRPGDWLLGRARRTSTRRRLGSARSRRTSSGTCTATGAAS